MHHKLLRRHFSLLLALFGWLAVAQTQAQVSLTTLNTATTQDFATLPLSGTATWGNNTTIPGWYSTRTTLLTGTGSSNTGGQYSFGAASSTERALGSVASGSTTTIHYGVRLKNETGGIITSLTVAYTGEQWRNGGNTTPHKLEFSYQTGAGPLENLTAGTFTDVDALDFTGPIATSTAGALDGNAAENRVQLTSAINGLSLQPGEEILLRWSDVDNSGSDHGLAIDDVSITPNGTSTNPTLAANPTSLTGLTTDVGTPSAPGSYTLTGSNLSGDVTVTSFAGVEVSSNGSTYAPSLTLTPSGGSVSQVISVRLTGASIGSVSGTVTNTSGALSAPVTVSGTVNDPNSFATIAFARSRPNGTQISSLPGGRIGGRVTASNQFGTTGYIQDATGGIAIFGSSFTSTVQVGDSVQITGGTLNEFNANKQVSGTVTFTNFGPQGAPAARQTDLSQLSSFEGQLVAIPNAVIRPKTQVDAPNPVFVLTPDANFNLQDGTATQDIRVVRFTNIPGNTNPAQPQTITGIVARFNQTLQIQPRFVQDIPGSAPYAPAGGEIDRNQTLDIATWNIEWLGNTGNGPSNEAQQLSNAITVLNNLQSDIIVLEEISSAASISQLVAGMPGYQGNCSPFVSNNPGHEIPPNPETPGNNIPDDAQRICILYKSDLATLVSQRPLLEQAQPLPGYPADADNFWASGRYPYLWTLDVKDPNNKTRRINVIGVHAKANTAPLQTSYDRRKYDVQVLYDSLKVQFPNELLVLTGDYNDDLDRTVAAGNTVSTYQPFVNDAASYASLTKTLSDNGFRSFLAQDNMIDHIVVSNELTPTYVPGSAGVGTPYTFIPDYRVTTSDHIPVVARFDLTKILDATASASTSVICPTSGSAQLIAAPTGGVPPLTYSWTGPGTITNASSATATVTGLPTGPHTFTLVVTDAAGQSVTATVSLTAEDKEAPVAKAKNITVELNAQGQATITPEQVNDGSTDNCGGLTFSLSKTTFDCSNLGSNTVTLTVTDPSGNTATASATVTVGPIPPKPNYATISGQLYPAGQRAVTVTQYSGDVVFSANNCSGQLVWKNLSTNATGTGNIVVPTTATGSFVFLGYCQQNTCLSEPEKLLVTVKAGPLQVVAPLFDCTTGQLTIRTIGGNGSAIEYQVSELSNGWTSQNTFTVEKNKYDKKYKLRARQRGSRGWDEAEFEFRATAVCSGGARIAAPSTETSTELNVSVLGNPVRSGQIEVEIRGASGQPLRLSLLNTQGQEVSQKSVERASTTERLILPVQHQPAGLLFLRVSTPTQAKIVKIVKQ